MLVFLTAVFVVALAGAAFLAGADLAAGFLAVVDFVATVFLAGALATGFSTFTRVVAIVVLL